MKKLCKTLLCSVVLIFALSSFSAPFDYVILTGADGEAVIMTIGEPPHETLWDCRGKTCEAVSVPKGAQR